jgi:hypothetical protein
VAPAADFNALIGTASMVEAIYREGGGRYDDAYLST